MSSFGVYARYYDLFYGEKDYAGEAAFVHGILREHGLPAAEILEIGCGTGRHALELAAHGHGVHGIDLSEGMLERAAELRAGAGAHTESLSFEFGDARTYRSGRTFDAVISLFHVMSYQTSNDDLLAAFRTAAVHLAPGGLFVFDCWYGPAVLSERPERRERTLSDDAVEVSRVATPAMDAQSDVCEVRYDISVTDRLTGATESLSELHPMRYLFSPEVAIALDVCGLDMVAQCEFGTGQPLSFSTWNGCFVARKR